MWRMYNLWIKQTISMISLSIYNVICPTILVKSLVQWDSTGRVCVEVPPRHVDLIALHDTHGSTSQASLLRADRNRQEIRHRNGTEHLLRFQNKMPCAVGGSTAASKSEIETWINPDSATNQHNLSQSEAQGRRGAALKTLLVGYDVCGGQNKTALHMWCHREVTVWGRSDPRI